MLYNKNAVRIRRKSMKETILLCVLLMAAFAAAPAMAQLDAAAWTQPDEPVAKVEALLPPPGGASGGANGGASSSMSGGGSGGGSGGSIAIELDETTESGDNTVTFAEAFPDPIFLQFVLDYIAGGGKTGGDTISDADMEKMSNIISINVSRWGIEDLTGIEYFTALTDLYCLVNQLTVLDVSRNTALTYLDCSDNQLTELNVSMNTALTYLDCRFNRLTDLDVSSNTALEYLNCADNLLTKLDVSSNAALGTLFCYLNQLVELDVSNNTALEYLNCIANQLTELDVSNNTALIDLACYYTHLSKLDVSNNPALITLNCSYNQLVELDVSSNDSLMDLVCDANRLSELDLSNNASLVNLYCYNNQLTELDVSNNTALEYLDCSYNYMEKPDNVVSWQELGLVINSPENPYSSTFIFYPQNAKPTPAPTTPTTKSQSSGVSGGGGSSGPAIESGDDKDSGDAAIEDEEAPQSSAASEGAAARRGGGAGDTDGTVGADWDNPFKDVHGSDWFYGDVMYSFANGIFRGTAEDMFEPDLPITQGMLVTALGRQNSVDEDGYAGSGFDNVDTGMYYAPYIEWARQNGIVPGVGENRFEPDAPVTRQDIAAIFARYAEYKEIALTENRSYTDFVDQAEIAGYAVGAVEALYAAEVVNGYPDGSFQPLGEATRAEVAAMLRRLLEATS